MFKKNPLLNEAELAKIKIELKKVDESVEKLKIHFKVIDKEYRDSLPNVDDIKKNGKWNPAKNEQHKNFEKLENEWKSLELLIRNYTNKIETEDGSYEPPPFKPGK